MFSLNIVSHPHLITSAEDELETVKRSRWTTTWWRWRWRARLRSLDVEGFGDRAEYECGHHQTPDSNVKMDYGEGERLFEIFKVNYVARELGTALDVRWYMVEWSPLSCMRGCQLLCQGVLSRGKWGRNSRLEWIWGLWCPASLCYILCRIIIQDAILKSTIRSSFMAFSFSLYNKGN